VNARQWAKPVKDQSKLTVPSSVVVIIDDDPAVRGSLKFLLEIEGFLVHAYGSAAESLNERDLSICGCLVVDQRMPGMAGLDLITVLRDRHIFAPAILITSYPNAAEIKRAARSEIPIVEKPLLGNALIDRIREACAQSNNACH
jgi:two-component system response regulator FixJ